MGLGTVCLASGVASSSPGSFLYNPHYKLYGVLVLLSQHACPNYNIHL